MIDVLLPALNAESTIETAVRSTLRALSRSDRLLSLDDGSRDGTLQILRTIQREDSRLEIFANSTPHGVSEGLNTLLRESRAPLIARMDADDVCLPWRFRMQKTELGDRDAIVFSNYLKIGRSRELLKQPLPIRLSSIACRAILRVENPLCHPTMLAHRETLTDIGGYEKGLAEDYLTWLKAIDNGATLIRSAIPVLLYRMSSNQTSAGEAWRRRAYEEVLQSDYWGRLYSDAKPDLGGLRPLERRAVGRALDRSKQSHMAE